GGARAAGAAAVGADGGGGGGGGSEDLADGGNGGNGSFGAGGGGGGAGGTTSGAGGAGDTFNDAFGTPFGGGDGGAGGVYNVTGGGGGGGGGGFGGAIFLDVGKTAILNDVTFTGNTVGGGAGGAGFVAGAAGAATGSGVFIRSGVLTYNVTAGTLTLANQQISGIGAAPAEAAFVKGGAGILVLNNAPVNNSTGTTTVNAGILRLGAAAQIPDGSALTVTAPGVLDLNDFSETVGSLAGTGGVTLGTGTLTAGGDGTSTAFSGAMSETGGFTKVGAGTLTLGGDNTYTGATAVNAGAVTLSATGNLSNTSGVTVLAGATLSTGGPNQINDAAGVDVSGTWNLGGAETVASLQDSGVPGAVNLGANTLTVAVGGTTFEGIISGTGGFTNGAGVTTLNGANTYSGATTVTAGTLNMNGATNGTGSLSVTGILNLGDAAGDAANSVTVATVNAGGVLNLLGTLAGATTVTVSATGTLTNGAAERINNTADITVDGIWNLGGFAETVDSVTGAGTGAINTGGVGGILTTGTANGGGTFAGVISNTGGLVKNGTGTMTLSGANTYTGTTTVNAGRLDVTGSTATSLLTTVAAGATLGGTGTVGPTVVNGTVAPGLSVGTLTVQGSFTQNAGSTYQAELNGAANSGDKINVTGGVGGTATINPGSTLAIRGLVGQTYHVSTNYTIVSTTGGVAGTYSTVTSNIGFITAVPSYTATEVRLTLGSNLAIQTGLNGNQLAIANVLDGASLTITSEDALAVFDTLTTLNLLLLPDAINQVDPSEAGENSTAAAFVGNSLAYNAGSAAHDGLLSGGGGSSMSYSALSFNDTPSQDNMMVFPPPPLPGATQRRRPAGEAGQLQPTAPPGPAPLISTWITGFGAGSSVKGNPLADGFDARTGGLSGGLGYRVKPDFIVGLAVGGAFTTVDGDGNSGSADISSWSIGAYAGHRFGPAYATAYAGYTGHDFDTERHIVFGAIDRVANGDHDGDEIDCRVELGDDIDAGDFTVTPFGALTYANLDEEGYDENGADSLNLHIDGTTTESLRGQLGARFSTTFDVGSARFTPMAGAAWEREMLDENQRSTTGHFLEFSDSDFSVRGVEVVDNAAIALFGLNIEFSRRVRGFMGYQGRFSSIEENHTGRGGLELGF
ncbi:MAG: autotransporter domain-containing protein, partial [Planctomycetes bacterium]|nr:autotransporter domain-containing protein [Planctomycetota bacterium]